MAIDWDKVRTDAAIAVIGVVIERHKYEVREEYLAKYAVRQADALVAELQKKVPNDKRL